MAWLKEPEGGFGDEYIISSVDHAIAQEVQQKRDTEAEIARLFAGSGRVELAEKGEGLTLTARFKDLEELRGILARAQQQGMAPK